MTGWTPRLLAPGQDAKLGVRDLSLTTLNRIATSNPCPAPGLLKENQGKELHLMPEKQTINRAKRDKAQGKSASTQAGEFVREEMRHIRQGKHGARSTKQAIAIGLSQARRAGVRLPPPRRGTVSEKTRKSAERAYEKGRRYAPVSQRRSRGVLKVLRREGRRAASTGSLARQGRGAVRKRTASDRSRSARKAAETRRSNA
jgi:hypothetical protein